MLAGPIDHEALAVTLNGRVWSLLEKPGRTRADSAEMVSAAHASLWHWLQVGTVVHQQRGEWLVARVYAVLGRGEWALHHARRALALVEESPDEMADFDKAYAHEGPARALAVVGRNDEAVRHRDKATLLGRQIAGPKDRELFLSDLAAPPWHGLDETPMRATG